MLNGLTLSGETYLLMRIGLGVRDIGPAASGWSVCVRVMVCRVVLWVVLMAMMLAVVKF